MRRLSARILSVAILMSASAPLAAQTYRTDDARPGSQTGFGRAVAAGGGDLFVGEAQNTYGVLTERQTDRRLSEVANRNPRVGHRRAGVLLGQLTPCDVESDALIHYISIGGK